MTDQEPQEQHEPEREIGQDLQVSTILMVGGVGAVIILILILFLRALYTSALNQENQQKVIAQPAEQLIQVESTAEERLHTYTWLDQPGGVVSIDIDQAMELTVDELNVERAQEHLPALAVPGRSTTPPPAATAPPDKQEETP